jgi:hypothetical protein
MMPLMAKFPRVHKVPPPDVMTEQTDATFQLFGSATVLLRIRPTQHI